MNLFSNSVFARAIRLCAAGLFVTAIALAQGDESPQLAQRVRGPADPELPFIEIVRVEKAPVIDGKLDDVAWTQAKDSGRFVDEYAFPVKAATSFRICQKDDVLYLAIRAAYDSANPPKELPPNSKIHDGDLWQGEAIELFLDPDNDDTPGYYQLAITPGGVTGDWYCNEPKDPEANWEPQYEVKVAWSPTEWTVEYALPLKAFSHREVAVRREPPGAAPSGAPTPDGSRRSASRTPRWYANFGLNVARVYQGTAVWSPLRSEGFHFPHRYGEARGLVGADVQKNEPGRFRPPYCKLNRHVQRATERPAFVPEKPPAFVSGPDVKSDASGVEIRFTANTRTDVAVWIEDEKGETVRHLVAGLLGPTAPSPLQKDQLAQTLRWNYRDDLGQPVPPGKFQVRVGLGSQAKLDRVIGWDPTPKQVQGVAVDATGRVLVVGGLRDEWTELTRFDRGGKFDSMLYPPPARVPPEKLRGMNVIDFGPGGQVRYGSHRSAAYLPHLDMPMPHTPLVNRRGQIILFGGEYLGGPTRFFKINPDGSLPHDFLGPYVKEFTWQQYFESWAKRFHFALDPADDDVIWLSGLKELHRSEYGEEGKTPRETYYNAVFRLRWSHDEPLEVAVGKRTLVGREGGSKPGEFQDPQGIAFDPAGNLWVCDRGNGRLQVFDKQRKFVREISLPGAYEVRVNKRGEAYVLSSRDKEKQVVLSKLSAGDKPAVIGEPLVLGPFGKGPGGSLIYYWTMALDESGSRPELVIVRGDVTDAHQIDRVTDLGDRFESPRRIVGQSPPREYKRVTAAWNTDEVWAGGHFFDAAGEYLGKGYEGEVAAARDGTWLTYGGFWPEAVAVYGPDWPRDPRSKPRHNWRLDPPALSRNGSRGFCVAPNGDVYVARYYQWQQSYSGRGGMEGPDLHVAIDHYSPEGKLIRRRVVWELSHAAASPAVDIHGNIYVTDNVGRRIGQLYEDDIAANLPDWVPRYEIDWDKLRRGEPLAVGYEKFVFNPLIKSVGTLYKFGPSGGGLLWRAAQGEYQQFQPEIPDPKNPTAGKYLDWGYPFKPKPTTPATHWSAAWVGVDRLAGMYPRWQEGVQWEFLGVGPVWGRYDKGHASCVCGNSRISVDDFGRVFAPAAHRNTVRMIDTAGNELLRIGRYGNLDSYGPGSPSPEVEIPLLFPAATALSKRFLYVTEWRHARILRIQLGYQAVVGREVRK